MAQHGLRTWTAAALAALVALTIALALGVTGLTPFGSSAEDEVPTADMPRIDHHDEALEQAREFRVRLATKGTPEQRKLARHVTAIVGIIFSKDGDVHIATDLTDSPQPGNAMGERGRVTGERSGVGVRGLEGVGIGRDRQCLQRRGPASGVRCGPVTKTAQRGSSEGRIRARAR